MTLTKQKKRILLIALPAALAVIAAAVILWLLLGRGSEAVKSFSLAGDPGATQLYECQIQVGLEQREEIPYPLPFYSLDAPEDWNHYQDAAQTAGPFSLTYEDAYVDGENINITFSQQYARQGTPLYTIGQPREVLFGTTQLIYSQSLGEESHDVDATEIHWVQGNSLLRICYYKAADVNQMLELVRRVEATPTRQPVYSAPTVRRTVLVDGWINGEFVLQEQPSYGTQGNPQPPEDAQEMEFPAFSAVPEGYTLNQEDRSIAEEIQYYCDVREYGTAQGDTLRLTASYGSTDFFTDLNAYDPKAFHGIPYQQIQDTSLVQDAVVKGNPALIYLGEEESSIGWTEGNYSLELRSTAPMTQEQLIALAERVETPN